MAASAPVKLNPKLQPKSSAAAAAAVADPGNETVTVTGPRAAGPQLSWTAERDSALVSVIGGGARNSSEVAAALKIQPAFAEVADAVNPGKVQLRVQALRNKHGADFLPRFGRQKYLPNAAELKAIYEAQARVRAAAGI